MVGRLPWSSNLTFLVTLEGSGETGDPDPAGGRPGRGDRSARSRPCTSRPAASSRCGTSPTGSTAGRWPPTSSPRRSGGDSCRPPSSATTGPSAPGSLQLFVAADYEQHYFTLFDEGGHEDDAHGPCAPSTSSPTTPTARAVTSCSGTDGRLWGIDHGLCFHRQHKLRTVIWDFADEPVPRRPARRPRPVGGGPAVRRLALLLDDDERAAVGDRIGDWSTPASSPSRSATGPPTRGRWSDRGVGACGPQGPMAGGRAPGPPVTRSQLGPGGIQMDPVGIEVLRDVGAVVFQSTITVLG